MTIDHDPAAAPSTVRTASLLYVIHGALRLVNAVVLLVLLPQTIAIAQRVATSQLQGRSTGGVDVGAVATGTAIGATVFSVLLGLAIGVLTIVFARKLLRGRNWARIVLLVFAVLALPGLVGFGGAGGVLVGLLSLVSSLAAIVGAVLTFLPASNPWFRRRDRAVPGV